MVAGGRLALRTSGPLRLRWTLLLAAMGFYIIALVGVPYQRIREILELHYLNTFTVVTIGMALRLLAVSSPPDEQKSDIVRSIDALLTVLICALGIADLFLPLAHVQDNYIRVTHFLTFTALSSFLWR